MCCHTWMMSYASGMPSVLLNPVFLALVLAILFVLDTSIGKKLDQHFGKTPKSITFISDRKNVTLLTEQILYVESNDAETWVHTLDGERYRNKTNISQWEQILEDDFLRTHRSFLVNINCSILPINLYPCWVGFFLDIGFHLHPEILLQIFRRIRLTGLI